MTQDARSLWRRLSPLMDETLRRPPEERADFIEHAAGDDAELLDKLRRWYRALATSEGFLEHSHTASAGAQEPFHPTLAEGQQIGTFRIARLIGRGGMGEVYAADRADGQFEQRVAIKVINAEFAREPEQFLAERRILAGLEHRGITRLFDGGLTDDGRPYMIMELVEGEDLLSWCRDRRLDLPQRLQLFMQLCRAVAYAHQRLVVHRDIKPGNVLVTRDGSVKLLDFGIAHLVGSAAGTADDARLMRLTPAFAAPEQLTGGEITTATDVYALGGVLYRLLTGQPPLDLSGLPATLAIERAVNEMPPPPSFAAKHADGAPVPARKLRGELDAILLKALTKDPQQRYQSAAHLLRDVERYLRREPVDAVGAAPAYLAWCFIRRHRLISAAAAAVLVTVIGAGVIVLEYAAKLRVQRDIADDEAQSLTQTENYVVQLINAATEESPDRPGAGPLPISEVLNNERRKIEAEPGTPASLRTAPALARLFFDLGDESSALAVWNDYIRSAPATTSPYELADAHQEIAVIQMRLGAVAEAQREVKLAKDFWMKDPGHYVKKLLDASTVEAYIARQHGDPESGVRIAREAVQRCLGVYGPNNLATADAYNNYAFSLQAAAHTDQAYEATKTALGILDAIGQSDTADYLSMLSNAAFLGDLLGRDDEAARDYERAITLRREQYGPSSMLAMTLLNYGRSLTRRGQAAKAVPVQQEALSMSTRFMGASSPIAFKCRAGLIEALVDAGNVAEAEGVARSVLSDARTALGPEDLVTAGVEIAVAHLRYAQQRKADAQALLKEAEQNLTKLGKAGQLRLGEAMKLRERYDVGPSS
jgi:non-specific serine/threonine protein kinase/serine/threonine-protein kinase